MKGVASKTGNHQRKTIWAHKALGTTGKRVAFKGGGGSGNPGAVF